MTILQYEGEVDRFPFLTERGRTSLDATRVNWTTFTCMNWTSWLPVDLFTKLFNGWLHMFMTN